jgi:hypothetical protein
MFERYPVIDVDTHITEPPYTWSSRMASKRGDAVPHVERLDGFDVWIINGRPWAKPGNTAMAGFDGTLPDGPRTYDDMHPAAWDPTARVAFKDEQGVLAQVLYPNIGGFGAGAWLQHGDPEFALECVQAYNDFQTDFASIAPERLLPDHLPPVLGRRGVGHRDRALRHHGAQGRELLQRTRRLRPAAPVGPALGPHLVGGP